jgi:hypothetical protein
MWYFSIRFWNFSVNVVFFYLILELFRQCGIFSFLTLPLEIYLIEIPELLGKTCSLKTFIYKIVFPLLGPWLMICTDK